MFGKIELENLTGLTSMPQKAASAWSAAFPEEMVGAKFKPLLYCGKQLVKGINHFFIAERTLILAKPQRNIVLLCINEWQGEYEFLDESVEVIL